MTKETIIKLVEQDDQLKNKLFCRGFLITDDPAIASEKYPFYSRWSKTTVLRFSVFTHPDMKLHLLQKGAFAIGLLGHAYNPISGVIEEAAILNTLAASLQDRARFLEELNQLTGIFTLFVIRERGIEVYGDAVVLQAVFCCEYNGRCYFSSHANLIGDLLNLPTDPYVEKLKKCRTFRFFGNQLPGNITRFPAVRRLNPNHFARFFDHLVQLRFYTPHSLDLQPQEVCDRAIDLLRKTMDAIAAKWERPAISLTGGCDSKTTLACAGPAYDRFRYFSYDSQPNERPDADAAAKIAEALELPHTLYEIPYEDDAFPKIEAYRAILLWNGGDVRYNNPNDVRKRLFFDQRDDFDIEVKSWASEIARSRYTKRYCGKKSFGKKPAPRKCTTFYKFLLFDRGLVHETDRVFRSYIDAYFKPDPVRPIPWQDQWYWEWHWPSRDGLNLTAEQQFAFDITVPYDNRKVLELMLSVPEEMRAADTLYTTIRGRLDARIDQAASAVIDVNHTNRRAMLETLYYYINVSLPY